MNGKKRHTGLWFLPGILPAGFSLFSYRKLHGKQKRAAADVFFCEALKKRDGILVPGALVKNGVIGAQLKDRLERLIGEDGQIDSIRFSAKVEDGQLKVTAQAECQEEIGKEVPGAAPPEEHGESEEQASS